MKKKHPCLLCMGSNTDRFAQLSVARKALRAQFPDIRFGTEMETEAIGTGFFSPFSNQLAVFSTSWEAEKVHDFFKRLEQQAGRRTEHKSQGIVRLDVDLLTYGDEVLKPVDLERPYVRQGLAELEGNPPVGAQVAGPDSFCPISRK